MKKKLSSSFSTKTLRGVVVKNSYKKTFVVISSGEEVVVYNKYAFFALKGDVVSLLFFPNKKKRDSVKIVEVERRRKKFVGVIDFSSGNYFFIADDPSVYFDVFITKKPTLSLIKNKKVVVSVVSWEPAGLGHSPVGKINDVLGDVGNTNVEISSILHSFGFNPVFNDNVLKEVSGGFKKISSSEIKKRLDFRGVTTFTIDPDDAKDFDDAISINQVSDGVWEIGVHIADVSHYVRGGSEIDVEAQKRGTSVYLVDRVIPMLPEKLSNDVCSLVPGVDKLCFSIVFKISSDCNILEYKIKETIINSNKRFTYKEAQTILSKKTGLFFEELHVLNSLAKSLRLKRERLGSVFFNFPEVSFSFNKQKKPIAVMCKPVLETTFLVEEFMLLANKLIAEDLTKKLSKSSQNFIYRVHDKPDLEKIYSLKTLLSSLDISFSFSKKNLSFSINSLLKKIRDTSEEKLLETLILRCMSKAVYSSKNIGHFGLGFDFYTHFTSPIRRYSDLIVHRIIKSFIFNKKSSLEYLEPLCKHLSQKEREATKAERESIKYMQSLYLNSKLGVVFSGVISGVVEHGFYVELIDNYCEGFVKLNSLKNDSFFLHKKTFAIIGLRTKISFQLGQRVSIKIISVDLTKKQSYFSIV